jgi:hypothetical protein
MRSLEEGSLLMQDIATQLRRRQLILEPHVVLTPGD